LTHIAGRHFFRKFNFFAFFVTTGFRWPKASKGTAGVHFYNPFLGVFGLQQAEKKGLFSKIRKKKVSTFPEMSPPQERSQKKIMGWKGRFFGTPEFWAPGGEICTFFRTPPFEEKFFRVVSLHVNPPPRKIEKKKSLFSKNGIFFVKNRPPPPKIRKKRENRKIAKNRIFSCFFGVFWVPKRRSGFWGFLGPKTSFRTPKSDRQNRGSDPKGSRFRIPKSRSGSQNRGRTPKSGRTPPRSGSDPENPRGHRNPGGMSRRDIGSETKSRGSGESEVSIRHRTRSQSDVT
jgi:hypothetical protein